MATDKAFTQAALDVLREHLEAEDIGYREMERRTGMNRGTLSKRLNGKHALTIDVLDELYTAAGMDTGAALAAAYKRIK